MKKTRQFTTSYKDDGSKIAELKQHISQKMTLLLSTLLKCHCEVISSFVIFAVLVLRFAVVVLIRCCKLSSFFINICCFGGMYWASLGIIKVHIKHHRHTYHSASAGRILSKSDHPRQSYGVIPFSTWWPQHRNSTSAFEIYLHTKFRLDISIHG